MLEGTQIERRLLLQRAMLLVGATAIPSGDLLAAPAKAAKPVLGPSQMELLTAVADTIVPATDTPGAVAADVPKLVEAMLGEWASPASRTAIVNALQNIDIASKAKTGQPFARLASAERTSFLKAHDSASLKPDPGAAKTDALSPLPAVVDPGYSKLKELIVVLYYQSETALTTELTYEHAPGKWQPSIPITPETRQSGGAGTY